MPEINTEPDLKRLGIFKELSYTTVNEPYTVIRPENMFRQIKSEPGLKPMVLAGGYSKLKSASDDGYFGTFGRVFEGEAGTNIIQLRRAWRREANQKKLGKEWICSNPSKKRVGTGSPAGCFQENYPAMSPEMKGKTVAPQLPNLYTNPGKKGTGYGYLDVTINAYPDWVPGATTFGAYQAALKAANEEHQRGVQGRPVFINMQEQGRLFDPEIINGVNPLVPGGPSSIKFGVANFPKEMMIGPNFIPSNPAKWDGGCKDGCLSKWPEYTSEPFLEQYRIMMNKNKRPQDAQLKPWIPVPPSAIVVPQPSIVNKDIDLSINSKTRKKRLFVTPFCKK